jgi:hypothetical protein
MALLTKLLSVEIKARMRIHGRHPIDGGCVLPA